MKCKRRRDSNKFFALGIFIDQLKILQKIMTEDYNMKVTFKELPELRTIKQPPKHFFKEK
jgi:hypothetical protein